MLEKSQVDARHYQLSRTLPFFLATKTHNSHKPADLLNRTIKLFVDFVPFGG
jgi:hypothetical protein